MFECAYSKSAAFKETQIDKYLIVEYLEIKLFLRRWSFKNLGKKI
jgi:hypothetical protein